jgi:ubiquinone/menaquinone biosynthesis C-methylase UbiE
MFEAFNGRKSDWRDEQRDVYDRMVKKSPTKHQYIYSKETLDLLDKIIPDKRKILDIGCGTGHIAQMLKKNWCAGVDISPKSIEVAKQFYKTVEVCDITKRIPFKDNMFDVVLALSILHHTFDYIPQVVREVKRVLKPNGEFIIIDHDIRHTHTRLIHSGILRLVPCEHEKALDFREVIKVLTQNNFKVTELNEIKISADQQLLKPNIFIRLIKVPILLILSLFGSKGKGDFLIRAKLMSNGS